MERNIWLKKMCQVWGTHLNIYDVLLLTYDRVSSVLHMYLSIELQRNRTVAEGGKYVGGRGVVAVRDSADVLKLDEQKGRGGADVRDFNVGPKRTHDRTQT